MKTDDKVISIKITCLTYAIFLWTIFLLTSECLNETFSILVVILSCTRHNFVTDANQVDWFSGLFILKLNIKLLSFLYFMLIFQQREINFLFHLYSV